MPQKFEKDPDDVLDYKFDWTDWLASDETISSQTITASSGLTVDSSSIAGNGKSVTVWLSSGAAGAWYTVTNRITTSSSPARTVDRTITIECKER
jgi:hypothetical protein